MTDWTEQMERAQQAADRNKRRVLAGVTFKGHKPSEPRRRRNDGTSPTD